MHIDIDWQRGYRFAGYGFGTLLDLAFDNYFAKSWYRKPTARSRVFRRRTRRNIFASSIMPYSIR
ncbi:hypothetical protein PQQ12_01930 [Salmonella enterica subsp. enterica serovar Dublin]|uniref:hypothetical protein n=1 Tax=Salmonella enterica TaxID=28901 RepID=UPI0023803628|nr:hypothetical protein [Salmonella enterica]WDX21691.1 hypothetical protein PQQ12_01930 [Salmonella enterica subsp. enterica serovar Dublin]